MFMKAILYTQYGPPDVLQFKEVAIPALADDAVLVKLCAASLNPLDSGVVRGTGRLTGTGLLKPRQKALGSDFAGRVEAVGRLAKQYQVGDEVFGGNIWVAGRNDIPTYQRGDCSLVTRLLVRDAKSLQMLRPESH
jgi:NADPH:quinone reductase-like Zn-dependent oxidoreductase